MKTVSFYEFAQYPPGTVFSFFDPEVGECRGLNKLHTFVHNNENSPIDFFYSEFLPVLENNEPAHLTDLMSRWGEFDFDIKYVIYEPADLDHLKYSIWPHG